MGAASSISANDRSTIYISYNDSMREDYLRNISIELANLGYAVMTSKMSQLCEKGNTEHLSEYLEQVISNTKYLIVCISQDTIKSFAQTIELNTALDYREKIIFLTTEADSSPFKNPMIKAIIQNSPWHRCYDDITFINCLCELKKIL
jgi:hypothetical protein